MNILAGCGVIVVGVTTVIYVGYRVAAWADHVWMPLVVAITAVSTLGITIVGSNMMGGGQ